MQRIPLSLKPIASSSELIAWGGSGGSFLLPPGSLLLLSSFFPLFSFPLCPPPSRWFCRFTASGELLGSPGSVPNGVRLVFPISSAANDVGGGGGSALSLTMPPVVRLMGFSGLMLNGEALVLWAGGFVVLQGSCADDGWRLCLVVSGVEEAVRMAYGDAWRRWMLLCGVVWPSVEGRSSRFPGQQQGLVPRVSGDGVAAACPSTGGRGTLVMAAMMAATDAVGVRFSWEQGDEGDAVGCN